jgi:hypothetical protein
MVTKTLSFVEQLFWSMVWIFLILILGFILLKVIEDRFGGSVLGKLADWVSGHAQPQQ